MRTALILAAAVIAAACSDDTTDAPENNVDTTAQPPAPPSDAGSIELIDDPNAPCERPCPDGSWCSYGRCVIN